MKNKTIISPIFYMGNKKKLINKGLTELFPKNINTFVDLFAGSAIVSMNTEAKQYVINDTDSHLRELYRMFKIFDSEAIIGHIEGRIRKYGLARERTKRNEFKDKDKIEQYKSAYTKLRDFYNGCIGKPVLDFYTLMFYSFSQQFRFNHKGEFNMPCGNDCFSEKNKDYIANGCKFFRNDNVFIYDMDFRGLDISALKTDDFVYLDPPYLKTTATYTENDGWNEKDEKDLYNLCLKLDSNNIKFGLSNVFENKGNTNQRLVELCEENKFTVYTFDKFTYMACGKGNSNAKEVFITNY